MLSIAVIKTLMSRTDINNICKSCNFYLSVLTMNEERLKMYELPGNNSDYDKCFKTMKRVFDNYYKRKVKCIHLKHCR